VGYAIIAGSYRMADVAAAKWGLTESEVVLDVAEADAQLGLAEPEGILPARPMVEYTSRKRREVAYGAWQPSHIAMHAGRRLQSGTQCLA
jgi:hypothetical protein